jgi:hypothetical protein
MTDGLGLELLMKRSSHGSDSEGDDGVGLDESSTTSSRASGSGSEDDGATLSSSSTSSTTSSSRASSHHHHHRMSREEVESAKRELLYQFDRLEKKGFSIPKRFSMASSLDEMRHEMARLKKDREVDVSVKFQRKMLLTAVTGIEFLNTKFDPFDIKLDGWSDKVNDDILDYDEIFEELHEKYKGRAKMPPELRMVFMLGGSGFMFHLTNTMLKSSMPEVGQIMQQNPELQRQFASATLKTMAGNASAAPSGGGMLGGLGGFLSSMMGGGARPAAGLQQAPPPKAPPPGAPTRMRGPSNVDDILREAMHNERIELMSSVSDVTDVTDIPDQVSVTSSVRRRVGVANKSRAAAQGAPRRTLNI